MPLKKRYSLSEQVITHIFDGEVSGNSFSGFHSEARKNPTNGRMIISQISGDQNANREANRPYRAQVRISVGGSMRGPVLKSMFPKNWHEADIIRWMEQALTDPTDKNRPSRESWTTTPRALRSTGIPGQQLSKIKINKVSCTVLYQNGAIASIYPDIV